MTVELITLLVRLATLVITAVIVPVVKTWIETKTDNEKLNGIKEAARTAVYAAEQIYNAADKLDPDGEERKKFARYAIKSAAYKAGIALTDREINEILEAAVQELNQYTHGLVLPE